MIKPTPERLLELLMNPELIVVLCHVTLNDDNAPARDAALNLADAFSRYSKVMEGGEA